MTETPPLAAHERAIDLLRSRIARSAAGHEVRAALIAWGLAFGTLLLAARALGLMRPVVWWLGGASLVGLAAFRLARMRRRLPSRSTLRAVLDARGGLGGLLVASGDADLGEWARTLPAPVEPRLVRAGPPLSLPALLAVAFVGLAAFLPLRLAAIRRPLDVSRETARLTEEVEALKEAEALPPEKADALAEELATLAKEAEGEDPAKTWETLDHLAATVEKAAREAVESGSAAAERLGAAESLAKGLAEEGGKLAPSELDAAMRELAREAAKAAAEEKSLREGPGHAAAQAAAGGQSLTPDQMKALGEALAEAKAGRLDKLRKLAQKGLVDPKALKDAEARAGQGRPSLSKFLAQNPPERPAGEPVSGPGPRPGTGDVTRGRGDAPMTWKDETPEAGARFREQALPPGSLGESQLVGLSAAAPEPARRTAPAAGALGASGAGAQAYVAPVLPRHRGAVRRYFERKE